MGLIGFKWVDTGFSVPDGLPASIDTIRCVAYGESGVCLAGGQDLAYLFRSTDYGQTWVSLGQQFSEVAIGQIAYLGNNGGDKTWVAGTRNGGKIIRSTDDGATWSDLGQITVGQTYITAIYSLGSGVCVAGTSPNGHIYRSTNWGATWSDLGDLFSESFIARFCKVSDTLLFAGTSAGGLILKSENNGVTWDNDYGAIGEDNLNDIRYLTGNIMIAATSDAVNGARLFRSIDLGANWTQVATQLNEEDSANAIGYSGDGVAVCVTWPKGESWRTGDYGQTWESRGRQFEQVDFFDIEYLTNGIFIGGTTAGASGKILRSTEFDEGGGSMEWNNANAVVVLAPNAWSKGNGTIAENTGNAPSYPDDAYQNVLRSNMGVGYGFVPNSEDGYENFDGSNDFIQTQYPIALTGLTTNLTIEMKCNLDLSALCFLWGLSDGTPQFFLYVDTDGSIYFRAKPFSTFDTVTNAGAVSASGDHTITARITNGLMAVYVDGVEAGGVGYATGASTITETLTYTDKLKIGTRSGSSNFDSKMYWFAVYEESISLARVVANHGLNNDMGLIGTNTGDILALAEPSSQSSSASVGVQSFKRVSVQGDVITPRAYHRCINYQGKFFVVMGYSGSYLGDMYWTGGLQLWKRKASLVDTKGNVITARQGFGLCAHSNKVYLMGGNSGSLHNDVYVSDDMFRWKKLQDAPWSVRSGFGAVSLNNRLYVIGGLLADLATRSREIWSTADGVNWAQEGDAPLPIEDAAVFVFNNSVYIVGGRTVGTTRVNQVWYSPDVRNWNQLESSANFSARDALGVALHDNEDARLVLVGGRDDTNYYSDLYHSGDGSGWSLGRTSVPMGARYGHSLGYFNSRLVLIGGSNGTDYKNDVWVANNQLFGVK